MQTETALHQTDGTWAFVMDSNKNLVAIKKSNTGSKMTEVHRLSAISGYQQFDMQTQTALHEIDDTWAFAQKYAVDAARLAIEIAEHEANTRSMDGRHQGGDKGSRD